MRTALFLVMFLFAACAAAAQTLSRNDIVQVQGLLSDMGYRTGVDGVMGPGTARVIREFQSETGLPVTGEPSPGLITRLRALHGEGWTRGAVFAPGSVAPSFDCGRASTASERTICSANELALLDRDVASAYAAALARNGSSGTARVKDSQRRWLTLRNGCDADFRCIHNAMTGQISVLNGM